MSQAELTTALSKMINIYVDEKPSISVEEWVEKKIELFDTIFTINNHVGKKMCSSTTIKNEPCKNTAVEDDKCFLHSSGQKLVPCDKIIKKGAREGKICGKSSKDGRCSSHKTKVVEKVKTNVSDNLVSEVAGEGCEVGGEGCESEEVGEGKESCVGEEVGEGKEVSEETVGEEVQVKSKKSKKSKKAKKVVEVSEKIVEEVSEETVGEVSEEGEREVSEETVGEVEEELEL